MDLWLVRTEKNRISGPYSGEKLKEMILQGELGAQDEICEANRYWISLHEREEVLSSLGIEVPASLVQGEEITETELVKELREPDLPEMASEYFGEQEGGVTESTAMLTARPSRQRGHVVTPKVAGAEGPVPREPAASVVQAALSIAPVAAASDALMAPFSPEDHRRTGDFYDPQVLRTAERSTVFRRLAILLTLAIVGGTLAVLWLLRTRA